MRIATLALTLALATPSAWSATPCVDVCLALVDEGTLLSYQGKKQQAYEKFKAAIAAAPEATWPLVSAATMLIDMSWHSEQAQAGKLRDQAEALTRQALRLEPANPMTQDVLRQILDGPVVTAHVPPPAARAAMQQAEVLFTQRQFDAARAQYEAVMALDPLWELAWIGAGDCYFAQQDWAHAEAQFRRATEIAPENAQGWRFLADSLARQGKREPAAQALYRAVMANPADRNTWNHLASLRAAQQRPLRSLHLERGSHVSVGADGKYKVNLDNTGVRKDSAPDLAFALSLALAEVNARTADSGKVKTVYAIELEAWRTALKIADQASAASGKTLTDPALLQMQAMQRDGQLEPALLVLSYRPPYRAAFDTWLAAHPDGVKDFIDRYGLQP
ncbi:tetratricopeptide repeat protein [Massilia sp. S19_KUP03_FR1]|uniref:tetratricopeptide repeat protein n=1 Tax=Massilia sp. S19_KUP03_FR1 TaxID=3025503 RepID=UPI002FCD8819